MKCRQWLRLALTIQYGDVLFVAVFGLSGFARRLAKTRQSAAGPIQVIIMRLMPSSQLQLSVDLHHLLNDDNWVESGSAAFRR